MRTVGNSARSAAGLFGWVVLFAGLSAPVLAETLTVTAGNSEIVFDKRTGVPQRWVVCEADCGSAAARRSVLMDEGNGYFRVSTPAGPGGAFSASVQDETDAVVVTFRNAHSSYTYRLFHDSARVTVLLPPLARLDVATGAGFIPEQLPGFGQIYSHVTGAQISSDGQDLFDDPDDGPIELIAEAGNWTGIRSRYWALLFNPAGAATATLDLSEADRPQLQLVGDSGDQSVAYDIYAGPVEWQSLKTVAPVLSEMLFGALWDFLRVLCFGMLILLGWLQSATGGFGLAIILLSLTVKVLMTPLTMIADRWQADVNRQLTLIKPELDEIKKNYKGEEAHMRVLAVYKKHGVSQLYTFKSAAGFLIQIPIFIAAFDMLAENFALNNIAFLWINDLAKPDRLVELPFVLPFFGGWLNLLPFIMTGLSVLSARLQSEATLSADLQRQQSTRLYLMSTAFFVLFYTFPAGMVLYWTSSNLFHLLKVESGKLIVRFRRGSR